MNNTKSKNTSGALPRSCPPSITAMEETFGWDTTLLMLYLWSCAHETSVTWSIQCQLVHASSQRHVQSQSGAATKYLSNYSCKKAANISQCTASSERQKFGVCSQLEGHVYMVNFIEGRTIWTNSRRTVHPVIIFPSCRCLREALNSQ